MNIFIGNSAATGTHTVLTVVCMNTDGVSFPELIGDIRTVTTVTVAALTAL